MGTGGISKPQLKRVYFIMSARSINCGFMKNVQNFYIKGTGQNCSAYSIEAKLM